MEVAALHVGAAVSVQVVVWRLWQPDVQVEPVDLLDYGSNLERSLFPEVGCAGKHVITLLHEHVGINAAPSSEVYGALVLAQGRDNMVFIERRLSLIHISEPTD